MDKQKYGESIVNQIIDAYKHTQEFQNDAVKFVKTEIANEINALNAQAFYEFSSNNNNVTSNENETISNVWADELCFNVEIAKRRRQYLEELFEITFGEGVHARP